MKTEELLRRVIEINREIREEEGIQTPTPALIGPTRSGKTERVLALAKQIGLDVVTLLPGTEYPEELLGYLRPVRKGDTMVVSPLLRQELAECVRRPHLLFIDELDKAHKETLSALLTLLAHRRVRNIQFHPDTEIVCALQPVDVENFLATETGRALAGRLLFLPINRQEAFDYIKDKRGVDLSFLCREQSFSLPVLPDPAPSLVDWAITFVHRYLARYGEDGLAQILYGAFSQADADALLEALLKDFLDVYDIAKKSGKLPEWVATASIAEVSNYLSDIITTSWKAGMVAIKRCVLELDVETASNAIYNALSHLKQLVDAHGGVYEFDPETSEEEGVELFLRTLSEISEELSKRFNAQRAQTKVARTGRSTKRGGVK